MINQVEGNQGQDQDDSEEDQRALLETLTPPELNQVQYPVRNEIECKSGQGEIDYFHFADAMYLLQVTNDEIVTQHRLVAADRSGMP